MAPYDTIVGIGIVFVCTKAFINTICMVLLGIWLLAMCTNRLLLSSLSQNFGKLRWNIVTYAL